MRLIPPGAADVAHYLVTVPKTAKSPIQLTAKLNYRKFSWYYTQFSYAGQPKPGQDPSLLGPDRNSLDYDFRPANIPKNVSGAIKDHIPDLPIVTLAHAQTTIPLGSPSCDPRRPQAGSRTLERLGHRPAPPRRPQGRPSMPSKRSPKPNPATPTGWLNVARALIQEGETDQAKPFIQKALEINPELGRIWFFKAAAEKADGDYDAALKSLEVTRAKYPRDRVVLNQIARILFLKREYRQAIDTLKQVAKV